MPTLEPTSQIPTFPLTVRRQMVGFKQRLAERIIEARESKGWDQRELAFRADVSDKTVQRLEQAKVNSPRGSTLRKIAEATDREVSDLRPDMDTEERNLRAQLDRIEEAVQKILRRLDEPVEADDSSKESERQGVEEIEEVVDDLDAQESSTDAEDQADIDSSEEGPP